jgi:hypothetical protein
MSDWDDLFASAAGIVHTLPPAETTDVVIQTKNEPNEKKKEGRTIGTKRKKNSSQENKEESKNDSHYYQNFLKSRMDYHNDFHPTTSTLPDWVIVTNGLGKQCHSNSFSSEGTVEPMECRICHRTALHHSFEIQKSIVEQKTKGILKIFLVLRNIRASCSCILMLGMEHENDDSTTTSSNTSNRHASSPMDYFNGGISKSLSKLHKYQHIYDKNRLPHGEQELLNEKLDKISKCESCLRTQLHKELLCSNGRLKYRTAFNAIVRLMMACDDYYFRLYYLQISGMLPTSMHNVPHPTTYFGTNYMARDCNFGRIERNRMLMDLKDNGYHWDETTIQCFGIDDSIVDQGSDDLLDPLTALHQHRFNETISIFWSSGWLDSEQTINEFEIAINSIPKPCENEEEQFYLQHSTPAPSLLSDWRDSCRDLLCNLYGYAAITPAMVNQMKRIFENLGVNDVIEMGSGTGYLGKVLEQKGISIECYDLMPPQTGGNEYHGSTPAFLNVKRGTFKNLSSIVSRHENIKNCGLLLCYPPPMNSMAKDTLDSFLKCGGKILIHIGEFKGLTGSSSFEKELHSRFELRFQQKCLSWGTDASTLSIWKRRENHVPRPTNPDMIRCIQCSNTESTIRLRMSRSLSFCGKECFEKHGLQSRHAHFQMSMIPHTVSIDFAKQKATFQIL